MTVAQNQIQNLILAALPVSEFNLLSPHLELTPMPLGKVYYESGGTLQHVYFPTTSIVSLHYVTESGASAEIAGVGKEGMVGISLFMGGNTTPSRASVRAAGVGYKMKAQVLMDELNCARSMQRVLLRYTQALITQTSQTAVCNQHHSVMQRLCRWLLMTLDRVQSNELILTQELVADMLGVRRETTRESIIKLQQAGYICCQRGRITILNRVGLEKLACECYQVVKKELSRLLGSDRNWSPMPEIALARSRPTAGFYAHI